MKKILLLMMVACFFLASASFGQTGQGKVLVGLSSGFNLAGADLPMAAGTNALSFGFTSMKFKSDRDGFEEPDPDKVFAMNLQPKVGYFVIDNLAIGLNINLAFINCTDGENDKNKMKSMFYGAGPFVRYYIDAGGVLPFAELEGAFGGGKVTDEYEGEGGGTDEESMKYSMFNFGGGIGVAIPIGGHASFDIMAGYTTTTYKAKEYTNAEGDTFENDDNDRNINGTFGVKFGFLVMIGD